jgi:dipeptidyl-peptidase-3
VNSYVNSIRIRWGPPWYSAEFEVAITDNEETKALLKLVEHSTQFIRLLPWANVESTENDGE